jgi:hypothetical protein
VLVAKDYARAHLNRKAMLAELTSKPLRLHIVMDSVIANLEPDNISTRHFDDLLVEDGPAIKALVTSVQALLSHEDSKTIVLTIGGREVSIDFIKRRVVIDGQVLTS